MTTHEQSTGERAVEDQLSAAEAMLASVTDRSREATREYELEMREARRRAEVEVEAKHRATLNRLSREKWEAQQAVDALRVQRALQGNASALPLGTEVERTVKVLRHSWDRVAVDTIQRGVVEVVTMQTDHPENVSDYRHAKVGEVVVRFVNAKGKRMKAYDRDPVLLKDGETWEKDPARPWHSPNPWRTRQSAAVAS